MHLVYYINSRIYNNVYVVANVYIYCKIAEDNGQWMSLPYGPSDLRTEKRVKDPGLLKLLLYML